MSSRLSFAPTVVLGVIAAFCLLWPLAHPNQSNAQDLRLTLGRPSQRHLLGTDNLGRDVLSRLAAGGLWSLSLAIACVASSSLLGAALGLAASVLGPPWEWVILRACDLVMAFPGLVLVLVLMGVLGNGPMAWYASLVVISWPEYCRISHAKGRSALATPYVQAAQLLGFSRIYIARRLLAPQVEPFIASLAAVGLGRMILAITSLSFVGIGVHPPQAAWGSMIAELVPYFDEAPVQTLAPCFVIFAVVYASQSIARSLAVEE